MDIATARMAVGSEIRVAGTVTVASGTFDDGFALQDAAAGIYVTRSPGGPYRPGDRVEVDGTVVVKDGGGAIEPRAVRRAGSSAVPVPDRIVTGALGAAAEGRLVTVTGRLVRGPESDLPWGWKLWLDDGSGVALVFVSAPAKIDVSTLKAGRRLAATGLAARYEQHFEVLPRTAADLQVLPD